MKFEDKVNIVAKNYLKEDKVIFQDTLNTLYDDIYLQGFNRGVEKIQKSKTAMLYLASTDAYINSKGDFITEKTYKCSNCDEHFKIDVNKLKYCYNCGAKILMNK